ncbi:hypothetical protein CRYPD_1419 [uncultured Candidatus Thioglobus sp.]|nr:hypothetical protein CRYPD_1419 [uncultured Candidatus Thioglobus sp.]
MAIHHCFLSACCNVRFLAGVENKLLLPQIGFGILILAYYESKFTLERLL